MSRIFAAHNTPQSPILYTDTDSFFWRRPVEKVFEQAEPYPALPFQSIERVPLEIGLRSGAWERGAILFRSKLYYQNTNSFAFSAWKPFPRYFNQIVETKPTQIEVERQVSRRWKTRDKKALVLRTGRWMIVRESWDLPKLRTIFRADTKRRRPTYDSYRLFLDDHKATSRAWTADELDTLVMERDSLSAMGALANEASPSNAA
jgi:hypothetical protein